MKTLQARDHYGKIHDVPADVFRFRVAVYGVLYEDGQVLLVQERWGRLWEFPGGGVKPWESIKEGLIREFREETGITVKVEKLLQVQEDFFYAEDRNEGWHSVRFIYHVRKQQGTIHPQGNGDDIIAADFYRKEDIGKDMMKPIIYPLLALVQGENQ